MDADCKAIREHILRISQRSGHGHIPTSFSVVEALVAVYGVMRHDPRRPQWEERDLFVLSKGHASLGFYCVLAHLGYFPIEAVNAFGAFGSSFGCHPDRKKVPGVEVSTGSLGHGIAVAAGMALALKLKRSARRVFTLIGDGEANEGTVWEALSAAAHLKLSGLTVLYDDNGSQIRCQPIPNAAERLRAFGCVVHEVDGHDVGQIRAALAPVAGGVAPVAVVCKAIKGFGCRTFRSDMFAWHRRSPNPAELAQLLEELNENSI
ncbi:MAG: transketolase [Planctomycetes bacterium]|nr:transketolase [Planctomycetota bacterium]